MARYLIPGWFFCISAVCSIASGAESDVDFADEILPILRASCYSCHAGEEQESGLRLDDRQRAIDGGDNGTIIVPGSAAASRLIKIVSGEDDEIGIMPPEGEGTPLSAEQVTLLRRWIDGGAAWPEGVTKSTGSSHWAFQPIASPKPPRVALRSEDDNGVDSFIRARLEQDGIEPSPPAARETLIRRLYLDLLGLPPDPAEVETFLLDARPAAYERLVDRVLASPHFGERWGRHWLDLARYADSDGYEKDRPRPFAWRYRNWVIDSLNADLPFDRFSVLQVAGDMLPEAGIEQVVASGFHRNTLHNTEGGIDKEEDRVKKTVDRTNTVGAIWMGLTVGCAQCHSHKYDPFTQREYYSLYGFFNDIDERELDAPLAMDVDRLKVERAAHQAEQERLAAKLAEYEKQDLPAAQSKWEAEAIQADSKLPPAIRQSLEVPREQRSPDSLAAIAKHFRSVDPALKKLQKKVQRHRQSAPPELLALVVGETPKARETRIHVRGDFLNPGQVVANQTPAMLPPIQPRGATPDRLDLAYWLTDPAHPLTSRVAVNRVWQRIFGRGIVKTVDDFGTQGDPPTHPELLDWLANEFVDSGWHIKALVRRIVTSATYRQSSAARPDLADIDPENALLARQHRRRVESEVIRDLALSASGLLDSRIGGPSVRPRQPAEYANLTYANSAKWSVSRGGDAYRRALYTFFQRTSPYPMLMTFDAPDSNACCAERSLSNTPLQALTLWNDPVFFECAQALGRRIATKELSPSAAGDFAPRLQYAYQLCLSRLPTQPEVETLGELYRFQRDKAGADQGLAEALTGSERGRDTELADLAAWTVVARTLLNLDEFITRE